MKLQKFLYNLATDKYRGLIPGIIKVFLFVLSLFYGLLVRILTVINHIRPERLNCKVISVGNITLGGTGKTSLVALIAQSLKTQGHKVAILSRGYKRKLKAPGLAGRQESSKLEGYEAMGDEPYMLAKNLGDIPVIVDADRIRAAEQAMRDYTVDAVILDDASQQWQIAKDLEIMTIDATNPFGNSHLLPRGILREPLSALRRADVFVLTKTNINPTKGVQDVKDFLNTINPNAPVFESVHKPVGFYKIGKPGELINIDALKAKTVTLFSGIADPRSFEHLIKGMCAQVGLSFKFPDHYRYAQQDLNKIFQASQTKNIDTIVTTEKDAVRLQDLQLNAYSLQLLVLRIELKINDEQRFYNRLLQLYSH